ncbi:MAG TPA: tripartite tricarboxylate transporter substrate binding protein [Casimicrobiaceae bacterium]|nr:tripartite tricarboxylate transporter substrate binding protein [Casimicrobiaceae bacterium]
MKRIAGWVLGITLAVLPMVGHAQAWPAKPIHIVAPSTPGDAPDVIARIVADKLSVALGREVVVDNKPGAGGVVGSEFVAKAAPDGYTLIMGNAGSHGINAAVYAKLPYDIQRDFAPVSQIAVAPNIFVVNPDIPAKTVHEFIAYAKSRPGQLGYASGGNGSSAHMSMELFKSMTGVDLIHVPYKGSSPALTDVVSGQDAAMIVNMPPAVPLVKAGKLRALAVTTLTRSPLMPGVPTVAESGLPGYETVAWFGVLAPANTSKDIVNRLSAELAKIAHSPEMRERLSSLGAEPVGSTPEAFSAVIARDIAKWTALSKSVGIKVD